MRLEKDIKCWLRVAGGGSWKTGSAGNLGLSKVPEADLYPRGANGGKLDRVSLGIEDVIEDGGSSCSGLEGYAIISKIDVDITICPNGGSFNGKLETITQRYVPGERIDLSDIEREGYDFSDWEIEGAGSAFGVIDNTFRVWEGDACLTATWEPVTYNITYYLNKGEVNGNPANYTVETDDFTLKNPTRKGYTFDGWTGSNGQTPQETVTIEKGSTGNKRYTANWTQDTYDITYNLEGGKSAFKNPRNYTVNTSNITLNNPTREGYTFTGWTGSNGNTPQTTVTINKGSTGNKTYTANWTPITYNITYNLEGGTNKSSNPANYTVETDDFTLKNPTRKGYTFTGWTGSNGNTPQTTVTINKGSTEAKEYTAHWTLDKYDITYNLEGGTSAVGNPTNYTVKTEKITLKDPTRIGYTFTGWTGSNGETPQKTVTINEGSTGDKNYTANWTPVTYNITYNLNDGEVNGNPSTYTVETNNITLNNPTRTGYTFTGWTGSNGGTLQTTVTIERGSTGDKNYTANWEPVTYNIAYNLNNGEVNGNPSTYTVETNDITLNNPTKTGYTFTGWTGSNGETPQTTVTIDRGSMGDKSYTANWALVTYNITYNLNNGEVNGNPTTYTIETESYTLINPTRIGYTFTGWTGSNGGNPQTRVTIDRGSTGDKNYTANWEANEVGYHVKHWLQKLEGIAQIETEEHYTLMLDEPKTGKTDSKVTPETKEYTGFTAPTRKEETIKGDGSLEVNYYYTRNKYKVIANNQKGMAIVLGGRDYLYEEEIILHGVIAQGYTWKGWQKGDEFIETEQPYYVAGRMQAQDIEFIPVVEPNTNTAYKVQHWKQKLNG